MTTSNMEFPLRMKRQYPEPFDADAYAETKVELDDIKTRANSYVGMIVSCKEDGLVYVLGTDMEFTALSGGSSCIGKETALYEGRISATGTYTLADDVNNYDFIIINHRQASGVNCQSTTLSKYEISKCSDYEHKFMCVLGYGSSEDCTSGYFNGNKLIIPSYANENITSITGYKFGRVTVENTITNPLQPISYSTDEQLTGGTWIDGKPIYRKVIVLNFTISTGSNKLITLSDFGVNNVETPISCTFISEDEGIAGIRNVNTEIIFTITTVNIIASAGWSLGNGDHKLIIEYTKKTD